MINLKDMDGDLPGVTLIFGVIFMIVIFIGIRSFVVQGWRSAGINELRRVEARVTKLEAKCNGKD